MDKITFLKTGAELMTKFAAPSVLTGYFVASVPDATVEQMRDLFTDPGPMRVHNMQNLYEDKIYTEYDQINEIRAGNDEIIIILQKGGS